MHILMLALALLAAEPERMEWKVGEVTREAKPLPLMHIVGEGDTVVPTATQMRVIEEIKKLNGCEGDGEEWAEGCTLYPSTKGAPIVVLTHDGGHKYPAEAPALIVNFFKERTKG